MDFQERLRYCRTRGACGRVCVPLRYCETTRPVVRSTGYSRRCPPPGTILHRRGSAPCHRHDKRAAVEECGVPGWAGHGEDAVLLVDLRRYTIIVIDATARTRRNSRKYPRHRHRKQLQGARRRAGRTQSPTCALPGGCCPPDTDDTASGVGDSASCLPNEPAG